MVAAARLLRLLLALLLSAAARMAPAALPPGRAPFGSVLLPQPVPGAARGATAESWRRGKLCDVSRPPFSLRNASNGTAALQLAIDTCGDLPDGGTVLVPRGLVLLTGSLWLRSNLTLRVEGALLGTATGSMATAASIADAPMVYTRRNSLMVTAHAGLINGGRCLRMKRQPTGGDDCAAWRKLSNVVIEGGGGDGGSGGTLDGNADDWYKVFAKRCGNLLFRAAI
jgi:hypothetical protein